MKSLKESLFDRDLIEKDILSFGDKYSPYEIQISFNNGNTYIDKYKKLLTCFPKTKLKQILNKHKREYIDLVDLHDVYIRGIDIDTHDRDEMDIINHIKLLIAVINTLPDVPDQYEDNLKKLFKDMIKPFIGPIWLSNLSNGELPIIVFTCGATNWIRLTIYFNEK